MFTQVRVWRYILLALGLALVTWLVMDFNSRMAELQRLSAEREYAASLYQEIQSTKGALETAVAYSASDAAAVKYAYENGHMSRPGDVIVIPLQVSPMKPTPTPRPVVAAEEISNPQRWLALFLGPETP